MSSSEQSSVAASSPALITVQTVRSWHIQSDNNHYNCGPNIIQVGFLVLECARLKRMDRRYFRSEARKRERDGMPLEETTWYVDGSPCDSLEQAAERLNHPVELTEFEAELLARIPAEFTPLRALRYHLAGLEPGEGGMHGADSPMARVSSALHMLAAKGAVDYSRAPVPLEESGPGRRTEPTIRRK